ncbi:MAG TPA: alanine racemase [Candidatus Hydrogenedentes bacterium]|nr:alanine racemase [Candidatus Hydrogenedentota bacterium]HOL77124.1 alanine racemase [Candidatus Hydrogenedentota bacterium]HPO86957.1 alanine racemase [Candidatus Hydrogenedentota bacterium]
MNRLAPSRAVIDLSAYTSNLNVVRACIPPSCRIMPVVKADAYGHGAVALAQSATAAGAYGVAVATVAEGIALREAGITCPILVLVQPLLEALEAAVVYTLEVMISDPEALDSLAQIAARVGKKVLVHCKIDTGMGRQGYPWETAHLFVHKAATVHGIELVGIATHFAAADDPLSTFTDRQLANFSRVINALKTRKVPYGVAHAGNSAAILRYGAAASFDMVRPGLMTYGVPPYEDCPRKDQLRPALRWETRVVCVKDLPQGAPVGYGCTYVTPRAMRTAIIPVGYADGYPLALSNRSDVLIRGTRCKVLGRVSMDQIVADVTALKTVEVGEQVTLIGQDGDEEITVSEIAKRAGTIPYEILTGIGNRVERVYTRG